MVVHCDSAWNLKSTEMVKYNIMLCYLTALFWIAFVFSHVRKGLKKTISYMKLVFFAYSFFEHLETELFLATFSLVHFYSVYVCTHAYLSNTGIRSFTSV